MTKHLNSKSLYEEKVSHSRSFHFVIGSFVVGVGSVDFEGHILYYKKEILTYTFGVGSVVRCLVSIGGVSLLMVNRCR